MKKDKIITIALSVMLLLGLYSCDGDKKDEKKTDEKKTETTEGTTTGGTTTTAIDSLVLSKKIGTSKWVLQKTDTVCNSWCRYYSSAAGTCTDYNDATLCIVCGNTDFDCKSKDFPNNFDLTQIDSKGQTCTYTLTRVGNPCETCAAKEGADRKKVFKFKALPKK